MPYDEYLQSPEWKARRNRSLRQASFRCKQCDGKRDLEVHHITYERRGHERDSDLEVLCRRCHGRHHQDETRNSNLGVYKMLVSEAIRNTGCTTFADLSGEVMDLCAKYAIAFDRDRVALALKNIGSDRMPLPKVLRTPPPPVAAGDVYKPSQAEAVALLKHFGAVGGVREMPRLAGRLPAGAVDQFRLDCGLWNRPDLKEWKKSDDV